MNAKTLLTDKRLWLGVLGIGILGLLILQLIPIEKSNPPVIAEPNWDSPQTRELVQTACFDCHSNETVYPWYSDVAPMRLLVRNHVIEGREHLNFSEYDGRLDMGEIREVILEGEMPPWDYLLLHPDAKLTDAEKDLIIQGLDASR